jgi:hypothetical protein
VKSVSTPRDRNGREWTHGETRSGCSRTKVLPTPTLWSATLPPWALEDLAGDDQSDGQ